MLDVGRVCVKTAGRDATKYCVVVEVLDEKHVLVDGNTRRKKVNKLHLEPLSKTLEIKKGADTKTVHELFEKANIPVQKYAEPKVRKEKAGKERERKKRRF